MKGLLKKPVRPTQSYIEIFRESKYACFPPLDFHSKSISLCYETPFLKSNYFTAFLSYLLPQGNFYADQKNTK